jgi:signal peptidase I
VATSLREARPLHLLTTAAELELVGEARATVVSGSMRPVILRGARLGLRRCAAGELEVGDPVVFLREDGSPCLHRVVARRGSELVTRGDANGCDDAPVGADRVIGTVQGLAWGRWQWVGAPRWLQRGVRRALLPVLPLVRVAVPPARLVRGVARRWMRRP